MRIPLLAPLLIAAFTVSLATAQEKKKAPAKKRTNPAMTPVEDIAGLPRVLLIGDSISIGYTVEVRQKLQGKVNVHRPLANCGPTTRGLESIDAWLDTGGKGRKWDLIHFNWGLHDLKYMGADGSNLADPEDPKSVQQVPPKEYAENLEALVVRLKKTGAKLIWRNTTPVPEGAKGRVVGDSKAYNEIAAKIMEKHGIPTQDLFGYTRKMRAAGNDLMLPKGNVHFTKAGSANLAGQVADQITAALAE